ncbi:MAG: hypothetical protein KGP29_06250 [Proteobacteria bacterium]|nr:hypothetical protein [Pseudomonadota bacterium]
MHGLISLYLGYAIYLIIFFRLKKRTPLLKKITIFLGIKLLSLTLIYALFFSEKMTKSDRQEQVEKLIINQN